MVVPVGGRRGRVPERPRTGRGGLRRRRRACAGGAHGPGAGAPARADARRVGGGHLLLPGHGAPRGRARVARARTGDVVAVVHPDGGGRRRGGAGVAPGGARDRSPGGEPRPGGDGGAGVGAHRRHRGGPQRGAAAPRRGRRAGHAARRRAGPRRLRVLRGDLGLSGALRLGAGDGVDEHVDPLLRARVDQRVHGAVPLPPGRDRPRCTGSWPRPRSGSCGPARSCGRSTASAPPGATASWSTSGFAAATWRGPRKRSRRPWPSATTASPGGAACSWREATRTAQCGASPVPWPIRGSWRGSAGSSCCRCT